MKRWIVDWVRDFRIAPPFSKRRRDILASLKDHDNPESWVEVNRPGSERWDDVYGYIREEFNIDENQYYILFHLEKGGYFTGHYMDLSVLDDEDLYRAVLDKMVFDLEHSKDE